MRNLNYLILMSLFFLMFIIFSCNKEKEDLIPSNKLATAQINGADWSASTFSAGIRSDGRIGVGFIVKENGIDRENLAFSTFPAFVGLIDNLGISNDSLMNANYATLSHDGDVVKDVYRLNERLALRMQSPLNKMIK